MHGAPLVVVMAWHYPAVAYVPIFVVGVAPVDAMQAAAQTALGELVAEELGTDSVATEQLAIWATPRQALLGQINPGTLLVLGHRELGDVADLLFGDIADNVVSRATCAVAVVP